MQLLKEIDEFDCEFPEDGEHLQKFWQARKMIQAKGSHSLYTISVVIFSILGCPPLTHIPYLLYSPDLIIQSTPSSRDLILSIHDIIHDIITHQA
jgi:hypothetical protein